MARNPAATGRGLTAAAILLGAAALRLYRLSGQSLWADEGNSVALARRGFVEIARRTAYDIHPPFYYWLLKVWITLFGDSEAGLRSLSVVLGVGLVYLIGVLGTRLFNRRVGLAAAFIAAFSPLQVYYAQEARMYMLLAVLSSLTILAAWMMFKAGPRSRPAGWAYVLIAAAGLYTHYAYPLVLAVVNLAALLRYWPRTRARSPAKRPYTPYLKWLGWQLIPAVLYLPWLPTAWRQITTWPSEGTAAGPVSILETISTTLVLGLSWPFTHLAWLPAAGLGLAFAATVWLYIAQKPRVRPEHLPGRDSFLAFFVLWLWFLLPVALTAAIFTPAFLKFLLVAAPPLALLLARLVDRLARGWGRRRIIGYVPASIMLALVTAGPAVSLYYYFTDASFARDNYRDIAGFIRALGGPLDAVILNAEGQQDVFNYYYNRDTGDPQAPVYPLPRSRPLNKAATLAELEQITGRSNKIFAVYWAARQADPNGLIENWLNSRLSKALDRWYGNVRLVSYANPRAAEPVVATPVDYRLGPHIRLAKFAVWPKKIAAGDILQVRLTWQTDAALLEPYTVFVQVLDGANHLVGQRDAPPLVPAPEWPVLAPVEDGHGVFIEPGTPPGKHRLVVGLYNSQTGQRLPVNSTPPADFVELAEIEIIQPETPLPRQAYQIQTPLNAPMLEVTLLGYDLYRLGHRSAPDTPLHPGDPLHLVAYWLPHRPVQYLDDQLFIQLVAANGGNSNSPLFVTRPPAGVDYPIGRWRPGEIVRAQYDLFLNGVEPGTYRLALNLGAGSSSMQRAVALTKPFRVEESDSP